MVVNPKLLSLAIVIGAGLYAADVRSSGSLGLLPLGALGLLMLMDAFQAAEKSAAQEPGKNGKAVRVGEQWGEAGRWIQALMWPSVLPFYVLLGAMAAFGVPRLDHRHMIVLAEASADSGGCGVAGGCGAHGGCGSGGCGAASGGACGCGAKAKAKAVAQPRTAPSQARPVALKSAMPSAAGSCCGGHGGCGSSGCGAGSGGACACSAKKAGPVPASAAPAPPSAAVTGKGPEVKPAAAGS